MVVYTIAFLFCPVSVQHLISADTFDDAYIIAPVVAVSLIGICIATFTCTTIALRKKLCKSPPTAVISIELEGTVCSSGHASLHTIQKNILDEVHLDRTVDNGKFGRVYRGEWRHEHVAVKIFEAKNTSSWDHEKMIYETTMFHHVNVLHCIMSGCKCSDMGFDLIRAHIHVHVCTCAHVQKHVTGPGIFVYCKHKTRHHMQVINE